MPGYLSTLPSFLTWFPIAAGMLAVFLAILKQITPWPELRMIRAGNTAVAIAYSGSVLGYSLVLAAVMTSALNRTDFLIWGLIGLLVQLTALAVSRILLGRGLRERMEKGDLASAILMATISLSAGILNAATMIS
ncbi:DUF350 domain-containing protein [Sabulicella rubraurantiaca]|uniref:DUF350 domain-containing protein n=1 Tax=Sabulicella rubraurantiaca TaxID=2811429 RepID=UPI001A96EC87|nr:DUF350 domain-containing protein [Sabulicella rubraurantiaca]